MSKLSYIKCEYNDITNNNRSFKFINSSDEFNNIKSLKYFRFCFVCKRCGRLSFVYYGYERKRKLYKTMLCCDCRREDTFVKLYGSTSVGGVKEFHEKSYITNYKKYGTKVPNMIGTKDFENSMLKKHGVKNSMQIPEVIEKANQTKLELYGKSNYMQYGTPEFKEYMIKKYNVDNAMHSKELVKNYSNVIKNKSPEEKKKSVNKRRNTTEATCGKPDYMQYGTPEFKEYMIKKYGHNYRPIFNEKAIQTKLDIYGTICFGYKYNYYGIFFDSSWELTVWIYCIDHGIPIIREPITFQFMDNNHNIHNYIPDFWIQGIGLVEIKGDQYFDESGKMIYPYNKRHHNSEEFTEQEKEYYNDLYERKHQCGLQNGVIFWTKNSIICFLDYINSIYNKSYLDLFRIDNQINPSYFGLNGFYQVQKPFNSIPIYYTPPIIPNKGISPYDIDKDSEYTVIKRINNEFQIK